MRRSRCGDAERTFIELSIQEAQAAAAAECKPKHIKCVVWDLDNTLWIGNLLEGPVELRGDAVPVIEELDARGILHCVASRSDERKAMAMLSELRLQDWILRAEINWESKAESIKKIAKALRLGCDTFAFVDDDAFERAQVAAALPQVRVFDSSNLRSLLQLPAMNPPVTEESRARRAMYKAERQREGAEAEYHGSSDEFLASINMSVAISPCRPKDLERAEELIIRTNQLNSSGFTYSRDELERMCDSSDYLILTTAVTDRFGAYGTVGLAVVELGAHEWTIRLLLVSCRVMSRGVAPIVLNAIMKAARDRRKRLLLEFVANDVNRPMNALLRLSGFREISKNGRRSLLEMSGKAVPAFPPYVRLSVEMGKV
jgi:FkbH-like protein